jgi:hypothetical protein
MSRKKRVEFGDFQTPDALALQVSQLAKQVFPVPSVVVEPTCGLGSFLAASLRQFGELPQYYGFDINEKYITTVRNILKEHDNVSIERVDFFQKDWKTFFEERQDKKILVIGNPPWVTNTALSTLNSGNLPTKSNFQRLSGLAAKTGKANFDIAEWMLMTLIEQLQHSNACVAMLCKTATARKVLKHVWTNETNVHNSSLHLIDAKKYFNVAVDACLFITHIEPGRRAKDATVYADLSFEQKISRFGMSGNELIANLDDYFQFHDIEGESPYTWRSGIKHDAAKVMELTRQNGQYVNGFGKTVDIDDDYVYPLLKSSDLGNGRIIPRKFVILTQQRVGDNTSIIKIYAPKTWKYLEEYAEILDRRKSIIYKKRPRFAIFGIGEYSFSLWKVAISGLYKDIRFSPIGHVSGKPMMLDDTCYFIPCNSEEEATLICRLLNSEICQRFLKSLVFFDAKRPINVDVLKRIDLKKLAEHYHLQDQIAQYLSTTQAVSTQQPLLPF